MRIFEKKNIKKTIKKIENLAVPGFSGVATDRGHETSEQHVGTHAAAELRRAAHGPRRAAQLAQHDGTCQVLAIAFDGACRALAPASHPPRCCLARTDATCHTAQSMDEQASFHKNINMLKARLRSEQQTNGMHQTTVRTGGSRRACMCVCVRAMRACSARTVFDSCGECRLLDCRPARASLVLRSGL